MDFSGHIILQTIDPVKKDDVGIFTVGGYAISNGDTSVIFDWVTMEGYSYQQDDGTLLFDVYLTEIDEDFITESNDKIDSLDEISPSLLTSGKIDELYYECTNNTNEDIDYKLKLIDFSIGDSKFSEERIQEFNKLQNCDEDILPKAMEYI